jgi:predicted amidohydrolase
MPRPVKIGLISVSRALSTLAEKRQQILDLIEEAGRNGANLVASPELADHHRTREAIAAYESGPARVRDTLAMTIDHPWVAQVRDLARKHKMVVIPNFILREGDVMYDSAVALGPEGNLLGRYDKTHLAPGEEDYFAPGQSVAPITTPFGKIGVVICWDIHFPELTRLHELQDADLLLWTTMRHGELEDGLFRQVVPARCITHQMPLALTSYVLEEQAQSVNPMSTAIWDPAGRIIAGAVSRPGVLYATIDLDARPTFKPYWDKPDRVDARTMFAGYRRPDLYRLIVTKSD